MIIGLNNSSSYLEIELDHTIYFSPFQKRKENDSFSLFYNYISPLEENYIDPCLQTTIDNNLLIEHENNVNLKWAPLASSLIKNKLRRYLVLKYALLNIINKYKPKIIYVGSNKDIYIKFILDHISSNYITDIIYLNYELYPHTTRLQDQSPTGITHYADPLWLTKILMMFLDKKDIIFENIFGVRIDNNMYYNIKHIYLSSKISYVIRKIIYNYNSAPVNIYNNNYIINKDVWDVFTDDEIIFIDKVLSMYYENYPIKLINKHENIIKILLEKIKPSKAILSTDILDYHRLVFHVANKMGIDTYNLLHGIYIDKVSGIYNEKNTFLPSHQLAWNNYQMQSFKNYKWNSININYPQFANSKNEYYPYNYNKSCNLYLLLMPDWISVHEKLDEFIFVNALNMFTEYFSNISCKLDIKIKPSHLDELNEIRKLLINKVIYENANYKLLDYNLSTDCILSNYDLVIGGGTTGMIESICKGVPIIFYNTPLCDIGLIEKFKFPNVNNSDELDYQLKYYNNDSIKNEYNKFLESIKSNNELFK